MDQISVVLDNQEEDVNINKRYVYSICGLVITVKSYREAKINHDICREHELKEQ